MSAHILLAEDDQIARMALGRILESAGYQVTTASDGAEAIQTLHEHTFDLVVSDIRMPHAGGIEVLQAAMSLERPPAVLLLTGQATIDTAISALRSGAADYLLKPCPPQTLIESVRKALERRRESEQQNHALRNLARDVAQIQRHLQSINVGDSVMPANNDTALPIDAEPDLSWGELQIGRFPHETRYRGVILHLTPIEHALLRCLVEAEGRLVPYNEIVNQTHGHATSDAEAQLLLKSHVRNLRRKLNDELIVNTRGAGYRIAPIHE
jgi:DNA-binding response OmpR family regulator